MVRWALAAVPGGARYRQGSRGNDLARTHAILLTTRRDHRFHAYDLSSRIVTKVLLVNQDGQVTVGPKALASAKVTGEVVAERRTDKVLVVKFKRRKNYRRHREHRQTMTTVRITKIEV